LEWGKLPPGTAELALVCDDPDAPGGTWTHWVLFGIPPSLKGLRAGQTGAPLRPGKNSWGTDGYRGPSPPADSGEHRYVFTLYALDRALSLGAGADRDAVLGAAKGHVLAEAKLVGKYQRR